ncbi:glycerol-3-phosphate dehydrogenase [Pseudoroseicyclus tamaricis]|uniref:Glycerol-3-phosphate dehydrogenase n=1 Tax=Pseudoroseicyclus tamaricis TaxID=2705421 RepID=A0A6B2JPR6_9RHOB|nr:glycerol-3-phosphate dehydrogenase [Pseudoroseicyclus tamaricis]NDV00677.1 glycerol-3-phosphate dehydrogenase [Pseudoroseicyclus tamaricis]
MSRPFDLFVIGGGVNGTGIARDAAGRGLKVGLAEKGDIASGTSSASTKLFHGGLRYLEYGEIALVRHALEERERLWALMPHIARPMRFILPLDASMRFDTATPISRLMPWLRGKRPAWMIRAGLFMYDHLGGRERLPATQRLDLRSGPEGAVLKDTYRTAFEYSDVWVDDARLVVLNARDAAHRGAEIMPRTAVTGARQSDGLWHITLEGGREVTARALVNAGGPFVTELLRGPIGKNAAPAIRLVRGSHIVVPKLFTHDKSYFFQGPDGRIIFAIPYEGDFTLLGTTEAEHPSPDVRPEADAEEIAYLCRFASRYFREPVTPDEVVWTYSGVRPLQDDGQEASAATRDYRLEREGTLLSVYGGKITTYRRLAEDAMAQLTPLIGGTGPWTGSAPLPGGDFPVDGGPELAGELRAEYPFLTEAWAARLIRSYGTDARSLLGGATTEADLGRPFGATLTEREVDYLRNREWAATAEDVLWRRSKLGLHMSVEERAALADHMGG